MEIITHNAVNLAWMGDALMTSAVRAHLLSKGYRRADDLQKLSSRILSAKGQAHILHQLEEAGMLTEEELTAAARGRAAKIRTKAKNADIHTYLEATALEAVLGYLYLYGHQERLDALLAQITALGDKLL